MALADAPGYTEDGQPIDFHLCMTDEPIFAEKEATCVVEPNVQEGRYYGQYDGEAVIRGIGSSEIEDTDNHIFTKTALSDMVDQSEDIIVILNHDSRGLPHNVFGSIIARPDWTVVEKDGKSNAAIKLASDVEFSNPAAVKTYEYIIGKHGRKRRLGFSVGALYKDVAPRIVNGQVKGIFVKGCEVVHWAIITQPACRVSWVETMTKSAKLRGILDPRVPLLSDENLRRVTDWRDFDPVNGVMLGRIADYLATQYNIDCLPRRVY